MPHEIFLGRPSTVLYTSYLFFDIQAVSEFNEAQKPKKE